MSQQTELLVKINVQDGASPEFRKIGQSAQAMGQQIDRTGQSSASTMQRLQTVARQAGLGVGLLGGAFTMFARSARDAERELMTLERTYGETADSLREFGDELQRTTAFSSEQAIEAANTFGTLSRNYGLTAEQIQNLITVSADLAAVNGISLADAAERVQAAIRGEAESAEALGLTMNETAIGLADVSAGMTEAEKAAYRYNALLGQAGFATGAAAEQADTAAGRMEQLTNTLQDAGRSVVDFTGPLGGAVAGLSNMSMELGMAVSGLGAMAPAAKAAATAIRGVSVAVGPVGLALALGTAAIAFDRFIESGRDYTAEARAIEAATDGVISSLEDIANTALAGSELEQDATFLNETLTRLAADFEQVDADAIALTTSLNSWATMIAAAPDGVISFDEALAELNDEMAGWTDAQRESITSTAAWTAAIADGKVSSEEMLAVAAELETRYDSLGDSAGSMGNAISLANSILEKAQNTGVNTSEVMGRVADAFRQFEDDQNLEQLTTTLIGIDANLTNITVTSGKAFQVVTDLGKIMYDAWWSVVDPMVGVQDNLEFIFTSTSRAAYQTQQSINGVTGSVDDYNAAVAAAGGNPLVLQSVEEQFYATASALEILDFELQRAGDDQGKINEAYANFAERVNAARIALNLYTAAVNGQNSAIAEQQRLMEANGTAAAEYTRTIYAGDVAIARYHEGLAALADPFAAQERQMIANGQAAAAYSLELAAAGQSQIELAASAYEATTSVGALDTALKQLTAIGAGQTWEYGNNVLQVANDALVSVNALGDGFRVLVENPIAWGKQAQEVADWSTALMLGADGVNSLSDLWGRGQIETITYNRGLEAQGRILNANADIQNDVARIQAKQLPVMADLIESQAKYIDGLADLDPVNQMVALGYMDATKAQQAQNLVMLAGAAAAGQYGALGTQMATDIITAAAQADPVLKAMLIDLGLITETEGEIDIKFTRAKSLNDDLQDLVASINALIIALGGIPPVTTATVDVRYNVNGRPALPGQIGFSEFATGGTVMHRVASATPMYATAATGRTTLVGEAGPELVSLPVGSQVTSAPATADRMSRRTAGSGGGVYFYGPVTLQPSSTDVEMAIRREALSGSRGY